jgi:hypothetical protein
MRYIFNLLLCALAFLPQFVVVPILLLTKWKGFSTWFGNEKWGRGNAHFEHHTEGFWEEFHWLTIRNPINNLFNRFGALYVYPVNIVAGNPNIGDNIAGGFCFADMGKYWEFYCIIPYLKNRCVRIRLGWKIIGKKPGELCPMVVVFNPIQNYSGVWHGK